MSKSLLRVSAVSSHAQLKPPECMPTLYCGIFDKGGNLVSLSEHSDPRETFCWSFNAMAFDRHRARPLDTGELAVARKLLADREVAHD